MLQLAYNCIKQGKQIPNEVLKACCVKNLSNHRKQLVNIQT